MEKEWGRGIITIKKELGIDIPLKYNPENLKQIILDITKKLISSEIKVTTNLFMEIYDLIFKCGTAIFMDYRFDTIQQRNKIIRDYYNNEEITVKNKYLCRILSMFKHLDFDGYNETISGTIYYIHNPEELYNVNPFF
jgi:hypothetical protein